MWLGRNSWAGSPKVIWALNKEHLLLPLGASATRSVAFISACHSYAVMRTWFRFLPRPRAESPHKNETFGNLLLIQAINIPNNVLLLPFRLAALSSLLLQLALASVSGYSFQFPGLAWLCHAFILTSWRQENWHIDGSGLCSLIGPREI